MDKATKQKKLTYFLAGWLMILRHPMKRPRDMARAFEMLAGDIRRVEL